MAAMILETEAIVFSERMWRSVVWRSHKKSMNIESQDEAHVAGRSSAEALHKLHHEWRFGCLDVSLDGLRGLLKLTTPV
jgi:hypothetical protein